MQSTLDPFGMPLVTQVVSGETADDRLDIPAIQQVRQGLKKRVVLYVGDCKLMSLENRAYLQAGEDYYLRQHTQGSPTLGTGTHCCSLC